MSSTLSATVHLRAWLLEEIESHLQETLQHVLDWTADLLTQLWADVQLPKLILEAWHILPPTAFKHFLDFAVRNYRSEVPQALLKSFMQRILSTGLATQPLTTEYGASASHILEYQPRLQTPARLGPKSEHRRQEIFMCYRNQRWARGFPAPPRVRMKLRHA